MSESIQEDNTWKILFDRLNALEKKVFQPEREKESEYPNVMELPEDFKLWGLSRMELSRMRDYAYSRGWKPTPAPETCPYCGRNDRPPNECCPDRHPAPELSKVEERIRFIIDQVTAANIGGIDNFKEELRALVVLAKDSVPECDGDH